MNEIRFGRLENLPLREAWKHEAHQFTPWLAENIDQLSEAIGIPLELTGTEVAVESFSADILARNPMDDTVVLIENQLEATDHRHLGQIMTYLAGLKAHTVVWIAPLFRQEHLSAISWLNEHTADGFSFFAVRARVVKIGDSPYAPIFEVVEQPNDWERQVKQKAVADGAAYYDIKEEFWKEFLAAHPDLAAAGLRAWRYPSNYITLHSDPAVELAVWIGRHDSGIYLRSGHSQPYEPVQELLNGSRAQLETCLGATFGPTGRRKHFLSQRWTKGHDHREDWPEVMSWMRQAIEQYRAALQPVLQGDS